MGRCGNFNSGEIAGISVGAFVGATLLSGGVLMYCCRVTTPSGLGGGYAAIASGCFAILIGAVAALATGLSLAYSC